MVSLIMSRKVDLPALILPSTQRVTLLLLGVVRRVAWGKGSLLICSVIALQWCLDFIPTLPCTTKKVPG